MVLHCLPEQGTSASSSDISQLAFRYLANTRYRQNYRNVDLKCSSISVSKIVLQSFTSVTSLPVPTISKRGKRVALN
jgi:hypothetical protein